MLALIKNLAVDLVGEHHQVTVSTQARDLAEVFFGNDAAGGVVGRIQNQQPGAVAKLICQRVQVQRKTALFRQPEGFGLSPQVLDHGLVDGEAGVGVEHLVAGFQQSQQGEEQDGFGAWHHHYLLGRDPDAAAGGDLLGDGFPQLRVALGRAVVCPALLQGGLSGGHNVRLGGEVRLADFQVDNVTSGRFQLAGPRQHLKRRLGSQPTHPLCKAHPCSSRGSFGVSSGRSA